MHIEFVFNRISRISLVPDSERDKMMLQLFVEAAKAGLTIGPSPHGQPDTVILQSIEEKK